MKSAPILLVALGLLLLYVILSDKYVCFTNFLSCLTGQDFDSGGTGSGLFDLPKIEDTYDEGRRMSQGFCESIFGVGSWFCNDNILPDLGNTEPQTIYPPPGSTQRGAGGTW